MYYLVAIIVLILHISTTWHFKFSKLRQPWNIKNWRLKPVEKWATGILCNRWFEIRWPSIAFITKSKVPISLKLLDHWLIYHCAVLIPWLDGKLGSGKSYLCAVCSLHSNVMWWWFYSVSKGDSCYIHVIIRTLVPLFVHLMLRRSGKAPVA